MQQLRVLSKALEEVRAEVSAFAGAGLRVLTIAAAGMSEVLSAVN